MLGQKCEFSVEIDVSIIDYGSGNLLSVRRAFEAIGCRVNEVRTERELHAARRLVLPGVGAFPNAMNRLQENDLINSIKRAAIADIPILGICLGMQLLFEESTEFKKTKGLGLIPGKIDAIKQLNPDPDLRLPRIGWFKLHDVSKNRPHFLLDSIDEIDSFYFVHSFMAVDIQDDVLIASSKISPALSAPSIVANRSLIGVQFHPEKSGQAGLKFLENFIKNT